MNLRLLDCGFALKVNLYNGDRNTYAQMNRGMTCRIDPHPIVSSSTRTPMVRFLYGILFETIVSDGGIL